MRKQYAVSKAAPTSAVLRARRPESASETRPNRITETTDDLPLTRAQIRELERSVADIRDPVRYLLASQLTPRFVLYYDVSEDTYVMNDPSGATLFKRHKAAVAVKRLLGGGLRIIRCTTRQRNGQRIPLLPVTLRTKRKG